MDPPDSMASAPGRGGRREGAREGDRGEHAHARENPLPRGVDGRAPAAPRGGGAVGVFLSLDYRTLQLSRADDRRALSEHGRRADARDHALHLADLLLAFCASSRFHEASRHIDIEVKDSKDEPRTASPCKRRSAWRGGICGGVTRDRAPGVKAPASRQLDAGLYVWADTSAAGLFKASVYIFNLLVFKTPSRWRWCSTCSP